MFFELDDIDIKSGVVVLEKGKWCKPRSVMIGIRTRKVLLDYRREINPSADSALFQVSNGKRLSPMGLRSMILRLSQKTGIHFTPHALRRTFATLALRAGMNPLHLQGLLGHSTLEMTRKYIRMVDNDFIEAHKEHGPIDHFVR